MKGIIKTALCICCIWIAITGCQPSAENTAPVSDTVIISQMKFTPDVLYINKWDTIVWINNDIVSHDVTEAASKAWFSDTIQSGSSWKTVLGKSADYFCSIHPTMKAKIVVRE